MGLLKCVSPSKSGAIVNVTQCFSIRTLFVYTQINLSFIVGDGGRSTFVPVGMQISC